MVVLRRLEDPKEGTVVVGAPNDGADVVEVDVVGIPKAGVDVVVDVTPNDGVATVEDVDAPRVVAVVAFGAPKEKVEVDVLDVVAVPSGSFIVGIGAEAIELFGVIFEAIVTAGVAVVPNENELETGVEADEVLTSPKDTGAVKELAVVVLVAETIGVAVFTGSISLTVSTTSSSALLSSPVKPFNIISSFSCCAFSLQ